MDRSDDEPLVTFPDGDSPSDELNLDLSVAMPDVGSDLVASINTGSGGTKFEQKSMTSASKTKVVTDGFSSEQASSESAVLKRLKAGDLTYEETSAAAGRMQRLEIDGITTEQNAALVKVS